jgi:hypothetical protein
LRRSRFSAAMKDFTFSPFSFVSLGSTPAILHAARRFVPSTMPSTVSPSFTEDDRVDQPARLDALHNRGQVVLRHIGKIAAFGCTGNVLVMLCPSLCACASVRADTRGRSSLPGG